MSKKDFKGGLESLLQSSEDRIEEAVSRKKKVGRPTTNKREITKSSQEKCIDGETRATFIVREDLLEKIKDIAYTERIMIKDVVNQALYELIESYPDEIKSRHTK